jgi:hypothetical protein
MGYVFYLLVIIFVFCIKLAAQPPVEGDELIKLIGLRQNNDKVRKLEEYIGSNIEGKGASITYDQNVVVRIDLYNSNNPFFQNTIPFAGKLPMGLDFSHTIFKAKAILGPGFEEDGEIPGAYSLSKKFPLNDLDAYKLNLDFRKGKMSMVSVIYLKGEAEKAEDAAADQADKPVIRGDDYFLMVKKNIYNKEVEKFIATLGFPDYEDRNIRMYIKKGVSINFNQQRQIEKITFYSGGQPTSRRPDKFAAFEGKMPYNLKFTDSREVILQKAGKPVVDDGNKMIFADNSGAEVEVQFSGSKINQVCIRIAEQEKKSDNQ